MRNTRVVTFTRDRRPVWLLDVDGVLNASRPGWAEPHVQGEAYVDGVTYLLRWAPELARRIDGIVGGGAVEVRWATTWVDHILQVERLLRLPSMRTAFRVGSDADLDPAELKLQAALHVVEVERRPLIWTDDDAIPGVEDILHRRIKDAGVPVLLLEPHTANGLQPEDVDEIDRFLARFTALAS